MGLIHEHMNAPRMPIEPHRKPCNRSFVLANKHPHRVDGL